MARNEYWFYIGVRCVLILFIFLSDRKTTGEYFYSVLRSNWFIGEVIFLIYSVISLLTEKNGKYLRNNCLLFCFFFVIV